MGSLPRVSFMSGPKSHVSTAPLSKHMAHLASSDRTALLYSDEISNTKVSFAELHARTNALARVITKRARPTGTNDDGDYVIAVCMQPTHNTIITLLAIWKAGAAYLPLETNFPQAKITHILEDAEPSLVIHDNSVNPSAFAGSGTPAVSFDELAQEASGMATDETQDIEILASLTNDTIAIVMYTSGSTGIPKGVRLSYSAICNRLWWQFQTFPYSDSEVTFVWKTSLTFLDSVCEIWGPLIHGRSLVILSRDTTRDPQKLVRVLVEHEVRRLVLVPTLLRSILLYLSLDPAFRPLKCLKLWVCSGETLSRDLALKFFQYFGDHDGYKLANFYGTTEVMADITYYVLETLGQMHLFLTVPIGVPISNNYVYLLDENMRCVREGEPGEVCVAGFNLARGYVRGKDPHRFIHNPHNTHPNFAKLYRTGDFGILDKGVILYAGRADSQVKIRGHRVDLQEVDHAVSTIPCVDNCVVLCYGVESSNPEILAFVTINPEARMSAKNIEAELKSSLTDYMIPQVIEIETVPLLVNGKVDRQALLKMYENTNNKYDSEIPVDIDYSGVEPQQMEAAQTLFETVGEVLGRAARGTLSVRAGFYELGGNSLNSIYTITKLRDRGYYIGVSDFLGATNLGEILSKINTNSDEVADNKEPNFKLLSLRNEHKQQVIDMFTSSFYEKAELEQYLKYEIDTRNYATFVDQCWSALLESELSFILTKEKGALIAVALNLDARDEPEIKLTGGSAKIITFLAYLEGPVLDTMLPKGKGTILHSFVMATDKSLNARENVAAIRALEQATMRIAREKRYQGVFATNTSPLTQQLAIDIHGFEALLDYQINQYVDSNGERIFGKASDDVRVIVCWKTVD